VTVRRAGRAAPIAVTDPHLICTVLGVTYAVPLLGIREVMAVDYVTPLPLGVDALTGTHTLRHQTVPLVDLGVVLEGRRIEPTRVSCALLVPTPAREGMLVALLVDSVTGVRGLAPSAMAPARRLASYAQVEVVAALADTDAGFLPILDPAAIAACADVNEAVTAWLASGPKPEVAG
jgi:chemotaxis signal transduction protein